eukprot:4963211-Prorocentrum_lima.AAC.1
MGSTPGRGMEGDMESNPAVHVSPAPDMVPIPLDKSASRRSETPSSDPEELDDDDKPLWDGKASMDM